MHVELLVDVAVRIVLSHPITVSQKWKWLHEMSRTTKTVKGMKIYGVWVGKRTLPLAWVWDMVRNTSTLEKTMKNRIRTFLPALCHFRGCGPENFLHSKGIQVVVKGLQLAPLQNHLLQDTKKSDEHKLNMKGRVRNRAPLVRVVSSSLLRNLFSFVSLSLELFIRLASVVDVLGEVATLLSSLTSQPVSRVSQPVSLVSRLASLVSQLSSQRIQLAGQTSRLARQSGRLGREVSRLARKVSQLPSFVSQLPSLARVRQLTSQGILLARQAGRLAREVSRLARQAGRLDREVSRLAR